VTRGAAGGILKDASGAVWTDRAAWHRVQSGLGWVAAGLAAGLVVLFLQWLPTLLHLSEVELAAFNDDEFWSQQRTMPRVLGPSVGLALLFFSACLLAGLFRCVLYPASERGARSAMGAFVLFLVWSIGWLAVSAFSLPHLAAPAPVLDSLGSATPSRAEQVQAWVDPLRLLGLTLAGAFVLFLRELGRDCEDRVVALRLWWLLGSAAAFACLLVVTASLADLAAYWSLILLAGLMTSDVLLIRLVLAARDAAARRAQ
jgi:hypothetical protein